MKKFAFLLLEILIGILLLSILFFPGIYKFREYVNSYPCYTVRFKDVDGLNVGSPVRLMGIQIGHVIKLELLESEIYVTFRITKKNTPIADGSIASVQFTGLAGSKSLEIKAPGKFSTKNKKVIYSIEPVRISSVMQVQTTISENVLEFCRGILGFFSKERIETTKVNVKNTSEYMQETNQSINSTLNMIKSSSSDIVKDTKEIKQFVDGQNKNLTKAYESFKSVSKDKNLKDNIEKIQTTVEELSSSTDINEVNKKVSALTNNINNIDSKVKDFNKGINKVKGHEVQYINRINNSLKNTSDSLQGFIDLTKGSPANKNKENNKN